MKNSHFNRFHELLHCADLLEDRLRDMLAPMDIRPKQARVLGALDTVGSAPQVALAQMTNVTAGTMSSMVSRLEKRGLISRQRNHDERRSDVLSLTDAGRLQLKDIYRTWQQMDDLMETTLGRDKALKLAELSEELRCALGGQVPGENNRETR